MTNHIQQMKDRLERMLSIAETGKEWADICLLEQRILDAETAEFKIVRMVNMFGCCQTILALRGQVEIGRAVLDVAVRGRSDALSAVWFVGAAGGDDDERFATELAYKPERHSTEEILARVELMLRLVCSAAESQLEAA